MARLRSESAVEVDPWWSMYLRRFDLEHTLRFLKQTLGWTRPHLREPAAADRWTWILLAVHTQLRLARLLAVNHRLPWQKPLTTARLTPVRVRAGYRRICRAAVRPARPPKPTRAGSGRPQDAKTASKQQYSPSANDLKG